jgi:hypothetical protein
MSEENAKPTATEAVAAAFQALRSYLPAPAIGVRVEEVVPPAFDEGDWRITLSHLEPIYESPEAKQRRHMFSLTARFEAPATERVYKVIEVNSRTGKAGAMRIRESGG